MAVFFISGHLDLTEAGFETWYAPQIEQAFREGASFVVGDARGTDKIAQSFLKRLGAAVTVYHMFEAPRNNVGAFETVGGFQTDEERDSAMTHASERDIAWVRPGREKSGTAKNLARRAKNRLIATMVPLYTSEASFVGAVADELDRMRQEGVPGVEYLDGLFELVADIHLFATLEKVARDDER